MKNQSDRPCRINISMTQHSTIQYKKNLLLNTRITIKQKINGKYNNSNPFHAAFGLKDRLKDNY